MNCNTTHYRANSSSVPGDPTDVGAAVDKLEKAFNLKPGTLGDTLGTIASYGVALGAASVGISLAAAAIGALGRALMVLSGASVLIGGAKGLGKLFGIIGGGVPTAATLSNGARTAAGTVATTAGLSAGGKLSGILAVITGLYQAVKNSSPEGMKDSVDGARSFADSMTRFLFSDEIANRADMPARSKVDQPEWVTRWNAFVTENGRAVSLAVQSALASTSSAPLGVGQQLAIEKSMFPGKQKDDFDVGRTKSVTIDSASIAAMIQPAGVQMVTVTNPVIPNVNVNAPITVTGVADPQAAASSAASQLGAKVKAAVESADTD